MEFNDLDHLRAVVRTALSEDITDPTGKIPTGDHSSLSSIPAKATKKALMIAKADGVIAGIEVAKVIFEEVDPSIEMELFKQDGDHVKNRDEIMVLSGSAQGILRGERIALNFMQRMSGTATLTRKFVDAVAGTKAKILDTRKTTPTLRYFEKWAVKIGGGENHRYGLFDMVMLKDNHVDFAGGIEAALKSTDTYLKERSLEIPIEIETRSLDEVKQVLAVGIADRIMLDNFSVAEVDEAVKLIDGRMETEVSGGIDLNTVRPYAECNPDFISVGALTHSAGSLDISLISKS